MSFMMEITGDVGMTIWWSAMRFVSWTDIMI